GQELAVEALRRLASVDPRPNVETEADAHHVPLLDARRSAPSTIALSPQEAVRHVPDRRLPQGSRTVPVSWPHVPVHRVPPVQSARRLPSLALHPALSSPAPVVPSRPAPRPAVRALPGPPPPPAARSRAGPGRPGLAGAGVPRSGRPRWRRGSPPRRAAPR